MNDILVSKFAFKCRLYRYTTELGSELSKTVATFIVQKILSDEVGGACTS
jgi:hypothetical protein